MSAPRKPNGRDLVDFREMVAYVADSKREVIDAVNGVGAKVDTVDRELAAQVKETAGRIGLLEIAHAEARGRARADARWTAAGISIATAVITGMLLWFLIPRTSATPQTLPTPIFTIPPAPAASPVVLNFKITQDPATGRITIVQAATPTPRPSPSPSAPPDEPVMSRLCELIPGNAFGLCVPDRRQTNLCVAYIRRVPCI